MRLLLLLLFSTSLFSEGYFTMEEIEQAKEDAKLIKDWEDRNRLRFFYNEPLPTEKQIRYSWIINSLDVATTIYALETMDNAKERNVILGTDPSPEEVIALKLFLMPLLHQNTNTYHMVWFNTAVTTAVINNLYVIHRYD